MTCWSRPNTAARSTTASPAPRSTTCRWRWARVGHPLRRARSLAELHDALWLVPGNIESPSNLLRLAYAAHGLPPPRDVIPCQSIAVGLALIAESDALGIFVRDLFEHQLLPRPLRMVPLDHALPAARACIVMRADSPPTPAAQCFMDCMRRGET